MALSGKVYVSGHKPQKEDCDICTRGKLLCLLLSALLAVTVLAGCGGGKALSQVIVDLLDGLYANISVEADSDLTAALKKAAAEGGTRRKSSPG